MKIGITANPHIPSALDSAKHVVGRLEPTHEVVLESDLARVFGRNGMPLAHMKADVVLAIGGDGTILRALQLSDAKVLGINSGSLGFLAEGYVEAIIVTAIAPFKPASRPHVFPAGGPVHIRLRKPKECLLVMDGQHESTLKGTEDVVLAASERRAKFIRFRDDFYRRIEEKLSRQ